MSTFLEGYTDNKGFPVSPVSYIRHNLTPILLVKYIYQIELNLLLYFSYYEVASSSWQ